MRQGSAPGRAREGECQVRLGMIQSSRFDQFDWTKSVWVQIGPKMAIFSIFGLIWTQFRSKQLKIRPGSHFQSNRLNSIGLTQSDRLNRINSIESTSKMASWSNFKLFRPKLSPNRTKNCQQPIKMKHMSSHVNNQWKCCMSTTNQILPNCFRGPVMCSYLVPNYVFKITVFEIQFKLIFEITSL